MREIKFRGRCLVSGEFVYGDLIHGVGRKKGNVYILPHKENLAYVKHCDPLDGVQVNPETVDQFTGFNDENGKELYVGDIILKWGLKLVIDDILQVGYMDGECTLIDGDFEILGNIHENPELL